MVFAELLRGGLTYQIRASVRPNSNTQRLVEILPGVELCVGDLQDKEYLDKLTRDVDVLFHIAGIHWSLPLVEAAAKNGIKRMVLVHSTGIYSKYKAAGEEYRQIDAAVERITRDAGIGLIILRPTMIYGTLKDKNIVQFIRMVDKLSPMQVVNGGKYLLRPVHVKDLGHAYAKVLENLDAIEGKNYILSGCDEIYLVDIFRLIADDLGIKRRFVSVPFLVAYAGAVGLYGVSLGHIDMREKVQRLCEDRVFSHEDAVRDFRYDPMPAEIGLRREVREYMQKEKDKLQIL